MENVRDILLRDKIENSYGLYLLDENASVIVKNEGGLLIKDGNVFPYGNVEDVRKALQDLGFPKNLFFFAWDDKYIDILEESYPCINLENTYYFAVPREKFKGKIKHSVIQLEDEFSETIAHYWHDDDWARKYVRERMRKYPFFGVRMDGEIVGWIGIHWISEKVASMGFLYVKKNYRRMGIAESLTARMVEELYSQDILPTVHIRVDNLPSLTLGKKLGFVFKSKQYWGGCKIYEFTPVGEFAGDYIEINEKYKKCLTGLKNGSHIKVIFVFHRAKGWEPLQHLHGDKNLPKRGVFALRTPYRPNPVGETLCRIEKIEGNRIYVENFDAAPGTPVIDIKPFARKFDCP